jgi:hypothetical protein
MNVEQAPVSAVHWRRERSNVRGRKFPFPECGGFVTLETKAAQLASLDCRLSGAGKASDKVILIEQTPSPSYA